MSLCVEQKEKLVGLLQLTQEEELDCDEFLARLVEFVEGESDDEQVSLLMKHHMEICPECAEERAILEKAIGR